MKHVPKRILHNARGAFSSRQLNDTKAIKRSARDVEINGIAIIKANGKGISVFDKVGINESPMSGWVWRFAPNTQPPIGLKLVQDKPHHFCIAPTQNMPISKYIGLLEELALKGHRVYKKEGTAV